MAINTYETLKASVINFSGRDDLSSNIDDFIRLAEESMYFNDVSPLRVRALGTSVQIPTVSGQDYIDLPADYLGARSINIEVSGNEYPLIIVSPSALTASGVSGIPSSVSVIGATLKLDKEADGIYNINLTYYASPADLDSTTPTNVILTNYPSIYLNGCLSCVYDYAGELERSEQYFNRMIRSIRGANRGDREATRSPTAQARVRGSTP